VGKLRARIIEYAREDLPTIIRFIEGKLNEKRQENIIGSGGQNIDTSSIDPKQFAHLTWD
jgi:hypothetical protein